jgi:hypothetical protein
MYSGQEKTCSINMFTLRSLTFDLLISSQVGEILTAYVIVFPYSAPSLVMSDNNTDPVYMMVAYAV